MIFNLFRKETEQEKCADKLYGAIVAQARQPEFYLDYSVEDSVNGRFEMIILHTYLLFYRLREEDEAVRELGQAVFNRFFKDMDHSLREIGIGDLSVPKKIKKMAQAFYGRIEAYDQARCEGEAALAAALSRNIFPEEEGPRLEAEDLARYVLDNEKDLQEQSVEDFSIGQIRFSAIPPVKVKTKKL